MSWPVSGFAIDRSKADFSRCPKIDSRFSQLKTGLDLLGSGSIPMFCSGIDVQHAPSRSTGAAILDTPTLIPAPGPMPLALSQSQLDAISAACRRHHVAHLHAFGSVLRSDYRPGESDIDLLVEFEPINPTELVDAYFGLEHQLMQIIGPQLDLVMSTAVRNRIVQATINASKQLIYGTRP